MGRAAAPWAARASAVRDRREAERHGAARDGRGLGSVALVGLRRDGMPRGRSYSRDFQLLDETRRRIRSGASSGAYGGSAQRRPAAPRRRLARDTPLGRLRPQHGGRTPDGLVAELDAFSDLALSCCGFCTGPQPFYHT